LRGSGRFLENDPDLKGVRLCFNPLHCGAVVASLSRPRRSSPPPRFNPLHCGAVVASQKEVEARREAEAFQSPSLRGSGRFTGATHRPRAARARVSIPFIAGQWSLLSSGWAELIGLTDVSIPFIAGQWSLPPSPPEGGGRAVWFQSPSLRGSGRFNHPPRGTGGANRVSIPFIAGQWSLPEVGR